MIVFDKASADGCALLDAEDIEADRRLDAEETKSDSVTAIDSDKEDDNDEIIDPSVSTALLCATSAEVETAVDRFCNVDFVGDAIDDKLALADSSTFDLPGAGRNRVHQKAILRPRSSIRCLRMKRTTRMKKVRAASTRSRSSQSAFSRAVISCLEVCVAAVSMSCWVPVERRVAVLCSTPR